MEIWRLFNKSWSNMMRRFSDVKEWAGITSFEYFCFPTDKKMIVDLRIHFTEFSGDNINIIVGLANNNAFKLFKKKVPKNNRATVGAIKNGSYDGVLFFKDAGSSCWGFEASNGKKRNVITNIGECSFGKWVKLGFVYDCNDGITATITPYIDDEPKTEMSLPLEDIRKMTLIVAANTNNKNKGNILKGMWIDYVSIRELGEAV